MKCEGLGWNVGFGSGRRCVRIEELEKREGFRVPSVQDMLSSNGVLPGLDECPMSWRERWCLRDKWVIAYGNS